MIMRRCRVDASCGHKYRGVSQGRHVGHWLLQNYPIRSMILLLGYQGYVLPGWISRFRFRLVC
jgi:hypothetical protein